VCAIVQIGLDRDQPLRADASGLRRIKASPRKANEFCLGRDDAVRMEAAMFLKIATIAALGSAALIQTGPASAAPAGGGAAARGLQLADRNCSLCHAIGAKGQSPNKSAPPFRTLHRRYPAGTLEEAFKAGLLTKHPSMPQMRFTPGELANLTAYFKALRSRDDTEASLTGPKPWRLARR
jgi:cytochrome c